MGAAGLCRVHAQLLDVNFIDDSVNAAYSGGNAPAPSAMSGAAVIGSPGDMWNGLGGFAYSAYPNGATFTSGTLVYANGAASGVKLSLTATNGTYDANAVGFNNYSPFSWASFTDEQGNIGYPNTPWAVLMASMLVSHTAGVTDTVSLSGLVPGGTYNLYVYSAGDLNLASGAVPGQRRSTFTVNGVTQTSVWQAGVTTLVNGTDYLEFTNVVANGIGNLVINYGNSANGDETDFNGFQLQTVTNQISNTNPPATQWNIVWSDEFNGTSINRNNWTYDLGGGGWGNNELETYTSSPQNSYVSNGLLHIVALTNGSGYTSARMKTQGLQSWTYGRMEARIQIPRGQGIWPAFWMLGTNIVPVGWPTCGEIDIMENIGKTSDQGTDHGTIHGPQSGGDYNGGAGVGGTYTLPGGAALADNFHIYGVEWTTNQITWFLDGNQFFTATPASLPSGGTWVFTQPQFFILNVAVGGNWPGNPDATTVFPQQMLVDYVRVYQQTAPLALSVATQSNGSMTLSWPTNIVCHLQVQTNSLVGGNWADLPGTASPYVVTPDPNQSAVFYRLESP
jgi:beta-glucanase (GH16 family)